MLQLIHLYWLFEHVVVSRLFGISLFSLSPVWQVLLVFVDYLEIPVIISVSIVYIHKLRNGFSWGPLVLLFLLNSQWLHILWITDGFVIETFTSSALLLWPMWLAWVAIGIDYLELPVMYDMVKRALRKLAT